MEHRPTITGVHQSWRPRNGQRKSAATANPYQNPAHAEQSINRASRGGYRDHSQDVITARVPRYQSVQVSSG
jgi:hypothetical protein